MKFSFSFKLAFVLGFVSALITGASVLIVYNRTYDMTIGLMGTKLRDVGRLGTYLFKEPEMQALKYLISETQKLSKIKQENISTLEAGNTEESLLSEDSEKLMNSPEFQRITQVLRTIKVVSREGMPPKGKIAQSEFDKDAPLVKYTYILITIPESKDRRVIKYIADGDYESTLDEKGETIPGNPIGNLYATVSKALKKAFDGQSQVEEEFIEDQWGAQLISATPIFDENGDVMAILGVDYDVTGEANKVKELFYICVFAVGFSVIIAIIVAIIFAKILSKPISILTEGAEKVAKRDFSTQIKVTTKDEFGLLANTFNGMVEEINRYAKGLEELNKAYYRFVPREFLENLGLDSVVSVKLGDQVQKEMSVLFSDIRSFTTLSESMSPKENFDFINGYFSEISPIIRKRHGFIDKFIGDAIMALFPTNATEAVQAGVDMRRGLALYNTNRIKNGLVGIKIGVGLHTGKLMLGTIGEEMRMEGTVISDAVNLASRLEGLTKKFGAFMLISQHTVQRLEKDSFKYRYMGRVKVKGKTELVSIFEVLDGDSEENLEKRLRTMADFEAGVNLYQQHKYKDAENYFKKVLQLDAQDTSARIYYESLQKVGEEPRGRKSVHVEKL